MPNPIRYIVTPHTGVWIETIIADSIEQPHIVTPHTGVWIETQQHQSFDEF